METTFPRFIVDKPVGEDLSEGQSQSRLAESISDYIRKTDNDNQVGQVSIPRIIGLEGRWGTGKSNVVAKIEEKLKSDSYYTFTYDSWGHQEDLQRRSILETLTNKLIQDGVLSGEVKIKMRSGKDHVAEWADQLQMLLSNKTTTITKSIPKFSWAAIVGILTVGYFGLSTTICSQLIDNKIELSLLYILLIELGPIILTFILAILYASCNEKWGDLITFFTKKNDNTIDEQFTSSEEPSVTEFKNWLQAISEQLNNKNSKKKKIIIVFDNMDRLPSYKVVQLWSLIYTFFAGSDFQSIWAIIPFDYRHLCEAVFSKDEEKSDRFKQFINKTFPIVFTIPKPVFTDYRELFKKFFEKAFGENEHDEEHICQVFMCLEEEPNPRTVICFINELVALRHQWSEEQFRLQNLALYVLKKEYILYDQDGTMESRLLSNELFDKVNNFYPQIESVRVQLCQFAYGLEDKKLAGELPLRKVLLNSINNGNPISEYAKTPHFVPVLESIFTSASITEDSLANAVKSFNSLDTSNFNEEEQERLNKKWDALANIKSELNFTEIKHDETLQILIQNVSGNCAKRLLESYCNKISKCALTNGADFYVVLDTLQRVINKTDNKIEIKNILQKREVTPNIFEEYVNAAKENYPIFNVSTDNQLLNEYVLDSTLKGLDSTIFMFQLVLKDPQYNFSELRNKLSERIENWPNNDDNFRLPALVNRLLDDCGEILEIYFNANTIYSKAINILDTPWDDFSMQGNEDIVAMCIAKGYDIANFEDKLLPRVCHIIEKYINYFDLINRLGNSGSALYKINRYMIENCIGEQINTKYVAQNTQIIMNTLNISSDVFFKQFNRMSFKWDENDISFYSSYVYELLFEDYKRNFGDFTYGLITLAVKAMEGQPKGFLNSNSNSNSYWISFVKVFLGTLYLPSTNEQLTEELKQQLDYVISYDNIRDEELLNCLLSNSPDKPSFIGYLNDKMSVYFTRNDTNNIQFQVFGKLFPRLDKNIAVNTCIGIIEHFIKPIYHDEKCAEIITSFSDFYLYIFKVGVTVGQPILKNMLELEIYESIHDKIATLINNKQDDSIKNNT